MAGIIAASFQKITGGVGYPLMDALSVARSTRGGISTKLNMVAANVIKNSPGRIAKIVIIAPGTTSGAFTLNDVTTVGAAAAANVVWSIAYNGANNIVGAVFDLDWYCSNGIVLSAVPGGGSPIIAVSYT